MKRRDALKLMAGSLIGGCAVTSAYAAGMPTTLHASGDRPVQAGWINSQKAREDFVEKYRYPFLGQLNKDIKGTGKGKKVFLWKVFEQVTGKPLETHYQTIGDCLVAGTLVTMADGSRKKIEQIEVGEYVLTHLGRAQKVTRTIRKPHSKRLIRFQASGTFEDVVCTSDHWIFVNGGSWKPAGTLQLGDCVYLQSYKGFEADKTYDLLDMSPDAEVKGDKLRAKNSSQWVNRYIRLDAKLAYVIGAYLAEGGCSRAKGTESKPGNWSKVDFNLGHAEEEFADKIATYMLQVFGVPCKVYSVPSKPTVKYVRCQCKAVATFFKHLMPGNTYTKEVPSDVLIASKGIQLECLLGWLEGDGSCAGRKQCKRQSHHNPRCSGVSVSAELIVGMQRLANRCGFSPAARKAKLQAGREQAYRLYFSTPDTARLYPGVSDNTDPQPMQNVLGVCRKLQAISAISKASTTVYCIDVENDHSFIANSHTVHNCVSHGFGLGVDVLTAVRIAMHNKQESWIAKAATEIIYAGSRVEASDCGLRGDGSMGVWAADFLRRWGVLLRRSYLHGKYDFTTYDGSKARKLGAPRAGVPDPLEPLCCLHPVKTCAVVRSWEECRDAIANGYPVVMCSNVGFRTTRDRNGFLRRTRRPWYHAMAILGIDDESRRPGALVQNSWGPDWVKGPTRHDQPVGSFWVDAKTIDSAMRQGDSIAMSGYVGYPRLDVPDYILY